MRWIAVITYNDGNPTRGYEIEELDELQGLVEMGPDWNTIGKIVVKLRETYSRDLISRLKQEEQA